MCGIVGLVTKKEKENTIKLMSDRIKHRGPDGDGYFIDGDVALGHRRLSIIDLSTGDQPMFNEDGSVVTVFNGEIYNYQELKEELIALGHDFKTKSDTEVLVHGYEEWHTDLPKHLRGMFAFAIYDKNKNEVFLARDNFGIKPLYYAKMNDTFMFASEIKAFLDVPDFEKVFNESILETYLEFSFVPTNETFFKGVHRLDAGCSLLYKDGEIKLNKYFKYNSATKKNEYTGIYKNKNVIYILAESLYPIAIDKELTPTLYKMTYEGFNFTNYYTPLYSKSTSDGEYMADWGILPKADNESNLNKSFYNLQTNSMSNRRNR